MSEKKNILKQFLQLAIFKYISQVIAALGIIGVITAFIYTTKETNSQLPKLKQDFEEHEKKDDLDKAVLKDILNEIKSNGRVTDAKLDDLKYYGQGRYRKETIDTIQTIKLHPGR